MSDTPVAAGSAHTTTPRNTYVEVSYASEEGVLLYRPEDNSFIALYLDEWLVCREEAHRNKTAIEELQEANRVVTEKSLILENLLRQPNSARVDIDKAQRELDLALDDVTKKSEAAKSRIEAIVNQHTDPGKLVELLPLTMKRMEWKTSKGKPNETQPGERTLPTPIYFSAARLKKAAADRRIYIVEGAIERNRGTEEKLFNGSRLNPREVRRRIANQVLDRAKFEKKWKLAPKDADQYTGILTDWAKVMGTTVTQCLERGQKELAEGIVGADMSNPDNPYRRIDLKSEAQFMRWAAGAAAEANFMPFQGNVFDGRDRTAWQKIKRVAKAAQFHVKANAEASFAIGEAKVETSLYLPHAAGWRLRTGETDQSLDLGYFRLRSDLSLYALAGASIAIEAGASMMITGGKQGLKGTPKGKGGVKAKVGAKGEAKIFAGLKEGASLSGALQWLSPEGFVDRNGPKKVDANKAIAEYADVASISGDASFIQGLAAEAGFQCDYRGGNFVIAAKVGACLGLGGSGNIAAKVGFEQIAQFLMYVAHQLKQADYRKLVVIFSEIAFSIVNKIMFLNLINNKSIESFAGKEIENINSNYLDAIRMVREAGEKAIKELENKFQSGWGWQSYLPPEARGALIASILEIFKRSDNQKSFNLRKSAAFLINELFSTIQSSGHLYNTLDRITFDIGKTSNRTRNIEMINLVLRDTPFEYCMNRCEMQMAEATPLLGRPFMRNDEPEFFLARLSLHHSGFHTA